MGVRCLEDLTELDGARVLLRIDLDRFGEISSPVDDPRILGVFTSVDWLLQRGARVTLCAAWHGGSEAVGSTLASSLEAALGLTVGPPLAAHGEELSRAVAAQPADRLLLLSTPPAEIVDPELAARMAAPFSHFVLDSFAESHLATSTVSALSQRFPSHRRSLGRAMQTEVDALACLMSRADRPNVAVLGGRVTARRLAAARALVERADGIAVVGDLGMTLLAASCRAEVAGVVDPRWIAPARRLLETAAELQVEIVLPLDLRVGRSRRPVALDGFSGRARPVDVGPATLAAAGSLLAGAETAFWCGETVVGDPSAEHSRGGDRAMARALAATHGFSVTAGLETIVRVGGLKRLGSVSHVVCGGEAALAFIAGERLPGLAVMED